MNNDCIDPKPFDLIEYTPEFDPFEPGLLHKLPYQPKKVVLMRASRIGDFINSTPAFQTLRAALPEAQIDVVTLPMLKDLAERSSVIDHYLPFPGYPGLADQFFNARKTLDFFAKMQAQSYDLAIQMQGTGVNSNPFMLMLGARWTVGFVRPDDPAGRLAAAMPWPESGHETERVLALTTFLGAPTPTGILPEFPLRSSDQTEATEWLSQASPPWIAVHIAARDSTRRWPMERFTEAAVKLQHKYRGSVILLGEARDRDNYEDAFQPSDVPYLNLAGCTSLPVTGAILQKAAVFLTNDTGPAHIAYAVGAPTVTIFGGGDPKRNGPLTEGPHRILAHPVACRPCEYGVCPIGNYCLEHISVEQVVAAAEEIFSE